LDHFVVFVEPTLISGSIVPPRSRGKPVVPKFRESCRGDFRDETVELDTMPSIAE
jgi:hypothetical protein